MQPNKTETPSDLRLHPSADPIAQIRRGLDIQGWGRARVPPSPTVLTFFLLRQTPRYFRPRKVFGGTDDEKSCNKVEVEEEKRGERELVFQGWRTARDAQGCRQFVKAIALGQGGRGRALLRTASRKGVMFMPTPDHRTCVRSHTMLRRRPDLLSRARRPQ